MNELDLIESLKDQASNTKNEAVAVVMLFFNKRADAFAIGERVEIPGLCSFHVKKYRGYEGRLIL